MAHDKVAAHHKREAAASGAGAARKLAEARLSRRDPVVVAARADALAEALGGVGVTGLEPVRRRSPAARRPCHGAVRAHRAPWSTAPATVIPRAAPRSHGQDWPGGMEVYFVNVARSTRPSRRSCRQKGGTMHQYLDGLGLRAEPDVPDLGGVPAGLAAYAKIFADTYGRGQRAHEQRAAGLVPSQPARPRTSRSVPMQRYGRDREVAAWFFSGLRTEPATSRARTSGSIGMRLIAVRNLTRIIESSDGRLRTRREFSSEPNARRYLGQNVQKSAVLGDA